MAALKLLQPESLSEALSHLATDGHDVKVLAGGTALVIMLKNRLVAPAALLSLHKLSALRYIRHEPGAGLRIGALTTIREVEMSPLVRQMNPVLAQTCGEVANVRVRNAATVGGNLSEADYASDPPAVLLALGARVIAQSASGQREILLADFFRGFYETALRPDELLTELIVPDLPATAGAAYLKYVTRSSEDRPCVGVAAVVDLDQDGRCRDLRVVAGAVAETPRQVASAEALARGERLSDDLIAAIAQGYADGIEPLSDVRGSAAYRGRMVRVFVRRAIEKALNGGRA
jgi:carbon-monoxide dehydrogenase medium subunit